MEQAGYEIKAFSKARLGVVDLLRQTEHKHIIHGLLEVDVTEARRFIREYEARTGEQLSFTTYIIACLAKAVGEDKTIQAYRLDRRKLIVFNDVDVNTTVERTTTEGEQVAMTHIFKAVDKRSYYDINSEMQQLKTRPAAKVMPRNVQLTFDIVMALPWFLRRLFWHYLTGDPRRWCSMGGTVSVTAVGMFGHGGGWGIPPVPVTLMLTLGGIAEKPGIVDGRIEPREYLSLTISFDHDIVDGAPAARFAGRLKQLIECGYGLNERPV